MIRIHKAFLHFIITMRSNNLTKKKTFSVSASFVHLTITSFCTNDESGHCFNEFKSSEHTKNGFLRHVGRHTCVARRVRLNDNTIICRRLLSSQLLLEVTDDGLQSLKLSLISCFGRLKEKHCIISRQQEHQLETLPTKETPLSYDQFQATLVRTHSTV
jgi:hypothetical protein